MPPHFRSLSLRNFRGFKQLDHVTLAPLTFLVGPNSSGKSSLFDALLLITQSKFSPDHVGTQIPNWIGPLVDLGSFKDAVYKHDDSLSIEIGVETSPLFGVRESYSFGKVVDQPMRVIYRLRAAHKDPIGRLSQVQIIDSQTDEKLTLKYQKHKVTMELLGQKLPFTSPLSRRLRRSIPLSLERSIHKTIQLMMEAHSGQIRGRKSAWQRIQRFVSLDRFKALLRESERVSSGRAAPRRWYSLAESEVRSRGTENRRVFDAVEPSMLAESQYFRRLRKEKKRQTVASVLKSLEIGNQLRDVKLSPYHLGINIKDSVTGVTSSLMDVGYGASQVIPVLRACLSGAAGPLYIEQPEIHLHPKAHGTLTDLICDTSRYRQVVVETHSVHMINRARILVARGLLPPSHVTVNYIERNKTGSRIYNIPVLENGEFGTKWPEGFFDERYEDTMLLLKLKSQKDK